MVIVIMEIARSVVRSMVIQHLGAVAVPAA